VTPFEPTEDQRAIGALAREIAAREIAPHIAGWDREHTFPRALYTKLNAAGLMGLLVPEAYGGSAADYVSYALMIEEVARVDAGTATTLSVHSMICNAIAKLGNDEQRERWLERLATGDAIAGFALTEPTPAPTPRRFVRARCATAIATCSTAASSGVRTAAMRPS